MLHGAVIWQRDLPVASAPQEQSWGESGKISRPEGLRSVSARAFAISFGATPSGRGRSKLWVRSGGWGQSIVKLKSKGTRSRSRGRCEASSPGGHEEEEGRAGAPARLTSPPPLSSPCICLRSSQTRVTFGRVSSCPWQRWLRGRCVSRKHRGLVPVSSPCLEANFRAGAGPSLRGTAPDVTEPLSAIPAGCHVTRSFTVEVLRSGSTRRQY